MSPVQRQCTGSYWARRHGVATGPGDRDRASIHDPSLLLSSLTCGPPENHPALAYATRMKALEQEVLALLHAAPCCGQGSRCCERQRTRNRFYTALVACARICKVFFPKLLAGESQLPVVTRRGPSHSQSLWRHGPSQ